MQWFCWVLKILGHSAICPLWTLISQLEGCSFSAWNLYFRSMSETQLQKWDSGRNSQNAVLYWPMWEDWQAYIWLLSTSTGVKSFNLTMLTLICNSTTSYLHECQMCVAPFFFTHTNLIVWLIISKGSIIIYRTFYLTCTLNEIYFTNVVFGKYWQVENSERAQSVRHITQGVKGPKVSGA